jgi:hypothetical protein
MNSSNISEDQTQTFNIKIPANIALGEMHENSGLESAPQKETDEQVKEWLTDGEFQDFAGAMRLYCSRRNV